MKNRIAVGIVSLLLVSTLGCASSTEVDVVDLNKVLDALVAVLDETDGDKSPEESSSDAAAEAAEVKPVEKDAEKDKLFLQKYAAKLNEMKVSKSHVGVAMLDSGVINGFKDPNKNNTRDSGEAQLFKVQIDAEGNRLIASDNSNHHRDHSYRPRFGGFFTGYLLGSMLSRQNRFGSRPNFRNMKMSPKNYHAQAVSSAKAKARASSARSRSGSKGFSIGK